MVLVRLVFQTKWGKANEVVTFFKEGQRTIGEQSGRSRILTDLSGPFHTVVIEQEVESLAEWERRRAELFTRPEFQEGQARAAEFLESGRAEFYTIEA